MEYTNDEFSKEVREIMGGGAHWMVRWAASLLVITIIAMLGVLFAISYPVFVKVPLTAAIATQSVGAISLETVVSEPLYKQIKIGQEVRLNAVSPGLDGIGRVDAKLAGRRVRLVFPAKAGREGKVLTTLQEAGNAKIKTGQIRLISQIKGIFSPK